MRSITSIGERYAALGGRIDRAVSIAHGLSQRKFAQYAANIAICIAGFPTWTAANNYLAFAFADSTPLTKKVLGAFSPLLILLGIFVVINIVRELLLEVGLYVIIKNSVSDGNDDIALRQKILRRLFRKVARLYDATRLVNREKN